MPRDRLTFLSIDVMHQNARARRPTNVEIHKHFLSKENLFFKTCSNFFDLISGLAIILSNFLIRIFETEKHCFSALKRACAQ